MSKILTVGEIKKILEKYDDAIPCVLTREGKGHQQPITLESIYEIKPYFPNEDGGKFKEGQIYLNIGVI